MAVSGHLRGPCIPYGVCVCVCDNKMIRATVILEIVRLSSYCSLADIWKLRNTYRREADSSVG